jgi:peptide/nickel transport system ATP-binding protein
VAQKPILSIRNLRVWYATGSRPVRAVDGVTLKIRAGETLGLVGESGCGKSTLGRSIVGLLPEGAAVDGEIIFDGRNLTTLSPKARRKLRGASIGMIFQDPMTRLNPLMTIGAHFGETIRAHETGKTSAEIENRSREALSAVGIPPARLRQYPHEFSGGMRQRIMIALAMVLRPRLVICDEPTTSLDVLVEAQILSLLRDLATSYGTALLFVTHNLGIVGQFCDRVAVMYAGEIVEEGLTGQIFQTPRHPYTRELLASVISTDTTALHYISGSPPDLADPPSGCHFHPRCPSAMEVCSAKEPASLEMTDGSRVSCWLHIHSSEPVS